MSHCSWYRTRKRISGHQGGGTSRRNQLSTSVRHLYNTQSRTPLPAERQLSRALPPAIGPRHIWGFTCLLHHWAMSAEQHGVLLSVLFDFRLTSLRFRRSPSQETRKLRVRGMDTNGRIGSWGRFLPSLNVSLEFKPDNPSSLGGLSSQSSPRRMPANRRRNRSPEQATACSASPRSTHRRTRLQAGHESERPRRRILPGIRDKTDVSVVSTPPLTGQRRDATLSYLTENLRQEAKDRNRGGHAVPTPPAHE